MSDPIETRNTKYLYLGKDGKPIKAAQLEDERDAAFKVVVAGEVSLKWDSDDGVLDDAIARFKSEMVAIKLKYAK